MTVQANFHDIKTQVEQSCKKIGRNKEDITIIAVTKYVTAERAKEALDAGLCHLGENRLEGLLEKYEEIGNRATWHFIGSLQSRKVKDILPHVDYIHSLDRDSLAKEINKRADRQVSCFVQVNVSGEQSKHGLDPSQVVPFIEKLKTYPNIIVVGLMTMAPLVDNEEIVRKTFRQLKHIRDEVMDKQWAHAPCRYLSMGMSNDFHIAVEEGATHIRIGTKLVGLN
ncbi:YggS family pyridoxal phosphate-dependent enzyme [Aquibacillus salsiterrae]|uniref:Pyridoxal phosphate homeostasis protein n=1 Tax=Aquibacillus salsiterrae TaxID=2950439 RepID=A0A9X4AE75_9BACI|nr:YggS family pyridoxal phosphate-dependent enzyme [Aquibacillus salsiterrae]MDC3416467.1 YggS family pyridoxal phosphate-dependent enzyme [Aquibacillus salsiterrae]